MSLLHLVSAYVADAEHFIAESTVVQYRCSVTNLERFAGRELQAGDLTPDLLNRYLSWLGETRKPATVISRRAKLMTLARWAAEKAMCPPPVKVKRPRQPALVIRDWGPDQVSSLIEAAKLLRGKLPKIGIDRATYAESLIRAAWDTALRRGDLLALERDWIRTEGDIGHLTIVQRKTGHQQRARLWPETMEAIDRCMACQPDRRLIWPLWGHPKVVSGLIRQVRDSAGIRSGTLKYLRRGSMTNVECSRAGTGHLQGGHTSSRVARKHYFAPERMGCSWPMPERIGTAS